MEAEKLPWLIIEKVWKKWAVLHIYSSFIYLYCSCQEIGTPIMDSEWILTIQNKKQARCSSRMIIIVSQQGFGTLLKRGICNGSRVNVWCPAVQQSNLFNAESDASLRTMACWVSNSWITSGNLHSTMEHHYCLISSMGKSSISTANCINTV